MTNATTARIDRTPTYNDLEIAHLVHRAMADVQDTGRFGDRKVFIASLWTRMIWVQPRSDPPSAISIGCERRTRAAQLRGEIRVQ